MRQVLHMSYFTYFMLMISVAGCKIDFDPAKPDFREFNNDMWACKIELADNGARQQYAWVHMQQLQHNFNLKRFEDALHIVSNYKIT
jgi:hypothetical protein